MNDDHVRYMQRTIAQAGETARQGNRPVASLIARDGAIIGEVQNTIFTDFDPSAHAEVAAIRFGP
jgi:tRNA(Arg) A34 adenosine deaminase TadA